MDFVNTAEEQIKAKVSEEFRIITNGDRFRVQQWRWWSWRECPTAGRYMAARFDGCDIGEYRTMEDAQAAFDDLVEQEVKERMRKQHGWTEVPK